MITLLGCWSSCRCFDGLVYRQVTTRLKSYPHVWWCKSIIMFVIPSQGIIQEFNLGVSSHVSIPLWCKLCSWWVWEGGTLQAPIKMAMRKCIQKCSTLLRRDLAIWEIQPLVWGKKLILICQLGCVWGIMHFIIQSVLLDYCFPFLILVCYIRLVDHTSNFQIVTTVLASLFIVTFCCASQTASLCV